MLLTASLLLFLVCQRASADARFDLVGPKIDVRVTRSGVTLPIAAVPNLQPGDRLWIHPDLPPTQSVKYLLIVVFLRGTTNPPPPEWFTRIETWQKSVREEGMFITVPQEAQQAVMFLAPETGGDFSTLRSAVQGRPGAFVRASQDLLEAGFEEARIERYIADIRRVPPADPAELQKHSDLLARTLALKPNADCFKRSVDTQFTCLTQSGSQIVLDDGHGQTISDTLNGPASDLIAQASFTQAAGGGLYSAYVGAIVDVVRIMGNLHTAQYQYIPAISFPQAEQMNLRLNTPPSFHNPKSVLVIALPAVRAAVLPPLRTADPNHVACMIQPSVTLPVEGAPLVFSADFAHNMVLHLNTPPGAPVEADIPLTPDAYYGGLVLQQLPKHHVPLTDTPPGPRPLDAQRGGNAAAPAKKPTEPEPVLLTGTVQGMWGFDRFSGPTLPLQQLPGSGWHIVTRGGSGDLIAGKKTELLLASTGTACVHTITARPNGTKANIRIPFKAEPLTRPPDTDSATQPPIDPSAPLSDVLSLAVPVDQNITPGDLNLSIQQYDQPKPDEVAARTFAEPATVTSVELHAGDRLVELTGTHLNEISQLTLGDLSFAPTSSGLTDVDFLELTLGQNTPPPSTHQGEKLMASLSLRDGRVLTVPVTVSAPRPSVSLLSKTATPDKSIVQLTNPDDLPLSSQLTFTLKSQSPFPRNGEIEIDTLDGTLRTVLTLAPSGGLLLQDPHTVVATLDPLRSFGPSAFGALHLRAIYPSGMEKPITTRPGVPTQNGEIAARLTEDLSQGAMDAAAHPAAERNPDGTLKTTTNDTASVSDWVPLATLVRLPKLTQLQCPAEVTQPCTLTGSDLFLVQAVSNDPAFESPTAVPDGFTGTTLTVPHASAYTVFLQLRDDPEAIDSAVFPAPPPPVTAHVHHGGARSSHSSKEAAAEGSGSTATPTAPADGGTTAPAAGTPASPNSPVTTPSTTGTGATQKSPATKPGPSKTPSTAPPATPQ
ncbi:hypothetical protein GOB94_01650 [Granulicella sp. 5B5]|nr:hypothetical protein GOB94_01650 [Granulicella sp. 5B5]